jgi:hypothetical protein
MKEKRFNPLEKDKILSDAFAKLHARGISSSWSSSRQPFTDLQLECTELMNDTEFRERITSYLRIHTTLTRSVQMLFTCISMAARAQWRDAPEEVRHVVARGWFLGRWIPTFLVIDGPIGRFLNGPDSPFRLCSEHSTPTLSSVKHFLAEKTFRTLRNGFAHWGFDWEVVGKESFVVAYDWERDLPIAKLHQSEADAYHIIAFAIVEAIYDSMLLTGGHVS